MSTSARSNSAAFLDVPQRKSTDESQRRRSVSPSPARSRSVSPFDTRHCPGNLSSKVALFNKQVNEHLQYQAINPFSGDGRTSPRPKLDKSDANYGKPLAGSKTAQRGQKAQSQVSKEILELCEVIAENGEALADSPEDDDCRVVISFGELFNIYTYISNKVVGILLRARKQKLLDFEGETLFQRKDDHVPIVLLKSIKEIRQIFREAAEKEKQARREEEERQRYLEEHGELPEDTEEGDNQEYSKCEEKSSNDCSDTSTLKNPFDSKIKDDTQDIQTNEVNNVTEPSNQKDFIDIVININNEDETKDTTGIENDKNTTTENANKCTDTIENENTVSSNEVIDNTGSTTLTIKKYEIVKDTKENEENKSDDEQEEKQVLLK